MTNNDRKNESDRIIESSGNVYADLGFAEPELELAKAKLARAIVQTIENRGLTQTEAGALTGLDQPKISAIKRGRLGGFSIDRLFRVLNALGQDVDISVHVGAIEHPARLNVFIER